MLDLAREEDRLAREAGRSFDDLIDRVDQMLPSSLRDSYDTATDRYLTLAGKGHRAPADDIELDRLDSALRMVLGNHGLFSLAARLVVMVESSLCALQTFRSQQANGEHFQQLHLQAGRAAAMALDLRRAPIPMPAPELAKLFSRLADAARSLGEIQAQNRWYHRLCGSENSARQAVSRLVDDLGKSNADHRCWSAITAIVHPHSADANERVDRVMLCYRLGGLSACLRILQIGGDGLRSTAQLLEGGLGA